MKSPLLRALRAALAVLLLITLAPLPAARAESVTPKLIAFTFDDGPSAQTPRLLDALEARGAAATFFMCGQNGNNGLYAYSSLVERMLALGCEPGNHSNRHPQFSKLSAAQMQSEITAVEAYLYQQAGAEYTEVVRIPYGENTATIRRSVSRPLIRWSVDPLDWKYRDADVVYQNIMSHAFDGAIVLLHDLYPTSVDAALRAMDSLRAQGYEFVTVSELFRRRGIALQSGQTYFSAPEQGVTLPAYSAPELTIDDGPYGIYVTASARDEGLTLHYTTDGSAPTLKSPVYSEPLPIMTDTQLRVAGFDRFAAATPAAIRFVKAITAPPRATAAEDGTLSLESATGGATIFYTTDGSNPGVFGTPYAAPFTPSAVTRAIARAEGQAASHELTLLKLNSGALFCDVPADAPYLAALDDVTARGLMSGVGDCRFDPQGTTTRAAVVTVLHRLARADASADAGLFSDVPSGKWYTAPIGWAAAAGIVNGMAEGVFAPFDPLTWGQAAVLLQRFAAYADIPAREADAAAVSDAPSYAAGALAWCAANGIPCGGVPSEPISRAGLATMLSALCALSE